MNTIVVYCGANKGNQLVFEEAAIALGERLAKDQIEVVYGGGSVGLMGVLADAMIAHGGKIKGIITTQLENLEVGHKGLSEMIAVDTMAERKTLLLKGTDGVITLPGGYGSMDELFEALCAAQLHLYQKPIGVLNVMGFYDPMIDMLDKMVEFGFLKAQNRELCIIESDIDTLLSKMHAFEYDAIPKWM
jgi:uncharacterized protein (TIGR00730 family)